MQEMQEVQKAELLRWKLTSLEKNSLDMARMFSLPKTFDEEGTTLNGGPGCSWPICVP